MGAAAAVALPTLASAAPARRSQAQHARAHLAAAGCQITHPKSIGTPPLAPTMLKFVNHDRSAVGLYWLNYSGYLQYYGSIAHNGSVKQKTYKQSAWVFLNPSFSCVGYVFVAAQHSYVIK